MTTKKQQPEHYDRLGRLLKVGDCVAYPAHNNLDIGVVTKLNPKMIKVAKVPSRRYQSGTNKYPEDLVLLDGPEVTMYLLKHSTNA